MENTAAEFDRLIGFLPPLSGPCGVGIGPTINSHSHISYQLLMSRFEVICINSKAVASYRDAMFNSCNKNDPKDAAVILEMLRRQSFQRYVDPVEAGTYALQEVAKAYYEVSRLHKGTAPIDQPWLTNLLS